MNELFPGDSDCVRKAKGQAKLGRNGTFARARVLSPASAIALLAGGVFALSGLGAMAVTVAGSPTSCVDSGALIAWGTPGNATVSDNNYASVTMNDNQISNYLQCTGYGFAIPAGATINGITVNVERKSSSTNATVPTDASVFLIKAGVMGTTNRATSTIYTGTDVTESHGGATDLWGTTWTSANINAANFGVAFSTQKPGTSGGNRTVTVDYIGVVVDYTPPPRACVSVVTGNWSNANTWNCGAGPGDGPPAALDSVTINGQTVSLDTSASIASLTINSGTLRQTGTAAQTLSVSGNITNSGTVTDNGGSGSLNLVVGGNLTSYGTSLTVDNLTVAANTVSSVPFTVNGSFNVGGDLTSNAGAFTVSNLVFQKAGTQAATFYGTQNTVGSFTVNSGSTVASTNYSTLNLKGDLINNGTINLPNTSWLINGTAAQTIGGTSDSTLGTMNMNNPSGLTLSRNVTVPGTLTLTNGIIATGTFSLISSAYCPASISGGSTSSYVNGYLRLTYPAWGVTCVYPVGSTTAYAPITVTIPWFNGIAGGTLTGSTANGEHPQISTSGINAAQDVNRYWTLGASGDTMSTLPSGGSYSVNLGFVTGDVDAGANVANFKVGMYAAGWSALSGSASGTTATYPGQTIFGSYAVGSETPPVVVLGKTVSTAAAAIDDYITFDITASNPSALPLNNAVVTDVVPTGMVMTPGAFYAATLGTVALSGQTVTWTIPTIPAHGNARLTLVVKLKLRGSFTNTAQSAGAADASATILVLPGAFTHYSMDEVAGSWTGLAGEVIDTGGTNLSGHRRTTTTPTSTNAVTPNPTIVSQHPSVVGSFCNAGNFDGNAVVESASGTYFQFQKTLSASAWIYPTAYPTTDLYSILSNDVNYEFHLDTGGHLYWWWQDQGGAQHTLTSSATIPRNTWTHVAITMDASLGANSRERIYINGVQDTNTNNWQGTLATNTCPFYVGGDISTGSGCALMPGRNFHGMIDEAKIYNYELSAAEVNADMNLGRQCGATTFDHIRIEHDGTASICSPKTVTVKACLDAGCNSLYPGTVTAILTPAGWSPSASDTVTITGGVATVTLSNASISAPTLTLGGTASGAVLPANTTVRCFNGATETCTLSVGATDCSFDAVEVGANPRTHLYTKLAGVPFNVDILAVGAGNPPPVDTTKNSTVSVDLVDTSSAVCSSTSPALNTAQAVTLVSGRKTVAMTCATIAPSAKVRIRIGTVAPYSYACSYDTFAVRPSALTLTSSNTLATPSSATDMHTIKAGTAFNIGATTSPNGYTGVLALVSGMLSAQDPKVTTQKSGGVIGTLGLAPFTIGTTTYNSAIRANTSQGSNATYSEVGYLYVNPGSFQDNGGATSVDQVGQLADCVASDTCDCLLSTNATNGNVPDNISDALINGRYGCYVGNNTGSAFGRFIPDHFDTAVNSASAAGNPMLCPPGQTCPDPAYAWSYADATARVAATGFVTTDIGRIAKQLDNNTFWSLAGFSTSNSTWSQFLPGFVYSGQAFSTLVTARNASGGTTQNYVSNFAREVTLSAWSGIGQTTPQNPPAGTGSLTNNTIAPESFSLGVAQANSLAYTLPVLTPPANIYLSAIETTGADGITSVRATPSSSVEGGVMVANGRIKASNAYGSELLPLRMTAAVQYYGANGWVGSTTDSVTTLKALASPYDLLNAAGTKTGTTVATFVAPTDAACLPYVTGRVCKDSATINLAKPGVAGVATITPEIVGCAVPATCYLQVIPGTATFGIYKNNNNFIYRRER